MALAAPGASMTYPARRIGGVPRVLDDFKTFDTGTEVRRPYMGRIDTDSRGTLISQS